MTITALLSSLQGVTRSSAGYMARCPVHDDRHASLAIGEGADGRILLHCHAGCDTKDILAVLGLKMSDLFPLPRAHRRKSQLAAIYNYTDEEGCLLFQCVRYEPKAFRQRRPDPARPGAWLWNLQGVRRVLYRLPEIRAAVVTGRVIFVCEGEKDVEALVSLGFVATCNALGAGHWVADYSRILQGAARVVIIADKDRVGRKHAHHVGCSLRAVVKSVKILELPDRNQRPVKDAADWIAAGGTPTELRELVKKAPEFVARDGAQILPTVLPPHPTQSPSKQNHPKR